MDFVVRIFAAGLTAAFVVAIIFALLLAIGVGYVIERHSIFKKDQSK